MPGLESWAGEKFSPELKNTVRILPNEVMKAFFICKIRKTISTL
jgi:hypothetical protein